MAGVFDLKKGAFDSSEATHLREAFEIALHGLRSTHEVDAAVVNRLARSIVRVARSEPDCLRNDGTIDPVRLAHRSVLRMLQLSSPSVEVLADYAGPPLAPDPESGGGRVDTIAKVMMKLFDKTSFAKL